MHLAKYFLRAPKAKSAGSLIAGETQNQNGGYTPTPWRAHTRGKITLSLASPPYPAGPERCKRTRLAFSGFASGAEPAVKLAASIRIKLLYLAWRTPPVLCATDCF